MAPLTELVHEAVNEIVDIPIKCSAQHKFKEDSYSAPAFLDYLDGPLKISDIPIQSSSVSRSLRQDPSKVPHHDSIKNLIFDTNSISTKRKFQVCIMLVEPGYLWSRATAQIILSKYLAEKGAIIVILPDDVDYSYFTVHMNIGTFEEEPWKIEKENLISEMSMWFSSPDLLIYCHDSSIPEYTNMLHMIQNSTWSISCTTSNFVKSENKPCQYVCPVFSYDGLLETRAVGSGPINFIKDKTLGSYEGKLNYYLRSIRGSRNASGRCYDCEILHRTIVQLFNSPLSTPETPKFVNFSPKFLGSLDLQ